MVDRQILVPIVAATVGLAAFGAFVRSHQLHQPDSPQSPPRRSVARAGSALTGSGFNHRGQAWTVVSSTSAVRMLIVEVDTTRIADAVAIAQQIVQPVTAHYDEALVFFFEPSARPRLASRRVQWTRGGGYRVLELVGSRQ